MGHKNERAFFIDKILIQKTISASFSRANIYIKSTSKKTKKQKENLKCHLTKTLKSLTKQYRTTKVPEKQHIDNIIKLSTEITEGNNEILRDEFRIGIAQKALNLYLKFKWCYEDYSIPPHCPFDSIVIKELPFNYKWTKLNSIGKYKELVEASKIVSQNSGFKSIAEWELDLWNTSA